MYSAIFRGDGPVDDVRSAFMRMKATGCTILVVGELSEPAQCQLSRRVMGEPNMDRTRILAQLGQPSDVESWFPGDVTPESDDSHVIEIEDAGRSASAAAASSSEEPSPLPERSDLASELAERIDAILEGRDLEPPELRVVAASAYYDPSAGQTIEQLVSVLNLIDGMTFLFLPRASVDDLDSALTDRVDALIDVRTKHADQPEHRWILFDEELEKNLDADENGFKTEWLPVDP